DADIDSDTSIAFVEDDKTIALPQRSDKRIVLIDAAGSAAPRYLDPVGSIQAPWGLAADPAGKTLFASYTDSDDDIYAWDLATGKPAKLDYSLPQPRNSSARGSLAVTRDGRWLAASGGDNYVRLYDVARRTTRLALQMDGNESRVVAFSPDGTRLAAVGGDNRLYIWALHDDRAERFAVVNTLLARSAVEDGERPPAVARARSGSTGSRTTALRWRPRARRSPSSRSTRRAGASVPTALRSCRPHRKIE